MLLVFKNINISIVCLVCAMLSLKTDCRMIVINTRKKENINKYIKMIYENYSN